MGDRWVDDGQPGGTREGKKEGGKATSISWFSFLSGSECGLLKSTMTESFPPRAPTSRLDPWERRAPCVSGSPSPAPPAQVGLSVGETVQTRWGSEGFGTQLGRGRPLCGCLPGDREPGRRAARGGRPAPAPARSETRVRPPGAVAGGGAGSRPLRCPVIRASPQGREQHPGEGLTSAPRVDGTAVLRTRREASAPLRRASSDARPPLRTVWRWCTPGFSFHFCGEALLRRWGFPQRRGT